MEYHASCHCQAIQFSFQSPQIKTALKCNCSICSRKNAVMSSDYIEPENFKLTKGKQALSAYQWGDKEVNHYFCRHCGIYPFHDSIYEPGKYRINLGCVHQLEITPLKITHFDGKNNL